MISNYSNSGFCRFPFFNLMVSATGQYNVCCKYSSPLTHQGIELNATEHNMLDAWESDSIKEIRRRFLKGEMPEGCTKCAEEEKAGINSTRLHSFDYKLTEQQFTTLASPTRLELYPGNVCNLKCRICFANSSTKWIAEAKDRFGYDEQEHYNLSKENLAIIKDWLPHITDMSIVGGEPFMYDEFIQMLKTCIEQGRAGDIRLLINTNVSFYDEEVITLLTQFKKVILTLSIDDIGARFEYQRKGTTWAHVQNNLNKFYNNAGHENTDTIQCHVCLTVSNMNIFYLDRLLVWLHKEYPGMVVYLNILHQKELFCIRNLPHRLKTEVAAKLNIIKNEVAPALDNSKRAIDDIISFMMSEPNADFTGFFREIEAGDKYRKENFAEVFPEYYEAIKEYNVA